MEDALFSTSEGLIGDDIINRQFQGLPRKDRLILSKKMLMEEKKRMRDIEKERRLQEEDKRKPAFLVDELRCKRCTATRNSGVAQSFAEVAYCRPCLLELVESERNSCEIHAKRDFNN
ncbi:hypothetical protein F25303_13501 [Fusarium sp. NRRL 25303]|nr:hypothetical protein F25303_13501 [Fusarium sp. NRRL 25303]